MNYLAAVAFVDVRDNYPSQDMFFFFFKNKVKVRAVCNLFRKMCSWLKCILLLAVNNLVSVAKRSLVVFKFQATTV